MTTTKQWIIASSIILTMAAAPLAYAKPGQKSDDERRGPPPEAFTACENLTQSQACTVNTPHGVLTGTCETARRDETRMVCVPEGHKDRNGPPPRDGEQQDSRPEE